MSCTETSFCKFKHNSARAILFICLEYNTQGRVTPDSISPVPFLSYAIGYVEVNVVLLDWESFNRSWHLMMHHQW